MDLLKKVYLCIVLLFGYLSWSEAVRHGKHYVDPYRKILKIMKLNNTLELQNLTILLKHFGLHDCSSIADHRHKVKI